MLHVTTIFAILLSLSTFVMSQEESPCNNNPCENGGECLEISTFSSQISRSYNCICPTEFTGIHCNLPPPKLTCGNRSIEILIDKRIVTEQDLADDTSLVHFAGSRGCNAVDRGDNYHLRVDAPFTDCGLVLKRGSPDGFYFTQQVVWNQMTTTVERPTVLLDFQCNYTDRYNVFSGPLIPTVTTVEMKTSYGTFTVQLDLFKDEEFSAESRHSTRPVIAVEQQVCVQQSLVNVVPEHLVLTLLRCWASTNKDGSGDTYDLISNKCEADDTTTLLANGEGSEARFCFQMFKWRESMTSVYLNCLVNVCNVTAFPEFCQCQNGRQKRSVKPMTVAKQQRESKRVSSELIRVVDKEYLDDWLYFLQEGPSESSQQDSTYGDFSYNDEGSLEDDSGTNNAAIIAIGVVLAAAVVILGVVAGVYFNFQKAKVKKLGKSNPTHGVRNQQRRLPVA